MLKYYTRACNFYYGKNSIEKIKKSVNSIKWKQIDFSFDTIEIITRKNIKKLNIKKN